MYAWTHPTATASHIPEVGASGNKIPCGGKKPATNRTEHVGLILTEAQVHLNLKKMMIYLVVKLKQCTRDILAHRILFMLEL